MKITHLPSSTPYQLHPQAQLAVERTNPFFHDYAEQTVPLDIPASDHNRTLLGYPDLLGTPQRQATIDAAISDGEYHAVCRQAVLSAQRKGNISTAFYINDGALYSRLQDTRLRDIFKDDTITFTGSTLAEKVANAIAECRLLRQGTSAYCDRLAIFPILVTDDSGATDAARKYKAVNLIDTTTHDFEGAAQRTETVNGQSVTLAPGYYISPFVKTAYVLRRLFQHYGYTLQPSLLTHTAPFTDMVFLNNVIDTIANGRIALPDILPDITVSETLALFRKKFRMEFMPDEQERTVAVVFLKDMADAAPAADLTQCLTEEPTIQYKAPKEYKRTVLKAKETVPDDPDTDTTISKYSGKTVASSYDNLAALAQANPAAFLYPVTGTFLKPVAVPPIGMVGGYYVTNALVAEATIPYDTGEENEGETTEIPECIPAMRSLFGAGYLYTLQFSAQDTFGGSASRRGYIHPYVGDYATVNSSLNTPGQSGNSGETSTISSPANTFMPMLCFSFIANGTAFGTITPYDPNSDPSNPTRLSDYALHYHGEDGIFERFHRMEDTLLRNALDTVKMRLLIPQHLKQTLPATAKVTVRGTALLLDKLKFTLGGKDAPQECDLRTLLPPSSITLSPSLDSLLPNNAQTYRWKVAEATTEFITQAEYQAGMADAPTYTGAFYLECPTAEMVGGQFHAITSYDSDGTRYWRTTRHLTVEIIQ